MKRNELKNDNKEKTIHTTSIPALATSPQEQQLDSNGNCCGPTYWSVVASLSFLCTGLLRAYTSPALLSIQNEFPPSLSISEGSFFSSKKHFVSWVASTAPFSSFLGTLLSGPLLHFGGRRLTLLLLSLLATAGWILVGNAWSIAALLLGRSLTGLASGLATATAPLYISEVFRPGVNKNGMPTGSSPTSGDRRGLFPGVMLSAGVLVGFILAHQIQAWRPLALANSLFPGALAILCWTIPESPTWLSTRKLDSSSEEKKVKFDLEMEQVVPPKKHLKSPSSTEKTGLIAKPVESNFTIYIRVGVLMFLQQWAGGNVIIYYLSEILAKTPVQLPTISGSVPAEESQIHQASLIIALVQFIGFFLALPLIDHPRVGRRTLLIISSVLMTGAHLVLGFHFHHLVANYIDHQMDNPPSYYSTDFIIRVSSLATLLAFYSIGLGPIPFLFISQENSEPNFHSSYISSFASLVNHFSLFVAVKGFPYLFHMDNNDFSLAKAAEGEQDLITFRHGPDVTFWLFASVTWITAMFAFFFLPKDHLNGSAHPCVSSSSTHY